MKEALQNIRQSADALLAQADSDAAAVDELRVRLPGQEGRADRHPQADGPASPPRSGPTIGALANEVREPPSTAEVARRAAKSWTAAAARRSASPPSDIDVTLPGTAPGAGHVATRFEQVLDELKEIFVGMGFDIVDGPGGGVRLLQL